MTAPDFGRNVGRTLEALRRGSAGDAWRITVAGLLAGLVAEMDAARRWRRKMVAGALAVVAALGAAAGFLTDWIDLIARFRP